MTARVFLRLIKQRSRLNAGCAFLCYYLLYDAAFDLGEEGIVLACVSG